MIEIKNLCKSFGSKKVINNISLKINDSSIFGLVGINGAGKSTLLRIMSGVYNKDGGEIIYDGINDKNVEVYKQIFFLCDDPYYDTNETVESLVEFYKTFYNLDYEKFQKYYDAFNLEKSIQRMQLNNNRKQYQIKNFSKGMKRQLFICIALAIAPKYLLLDEAFDGLDPLARLVFKKIVIELMQEKEITIIISSHSLRELEDICDCYCLIDEGEIQSTGNVEEQKNNYHKFQIAFERDVEKEEFVGLNIVSFTKIGRVIKMICSGDYDNCLRVINSKNPLIIDEISIDFEELFIIEVERKGYVNYE